MKTHEAAHAAVGPVAEPRRGLLAWYLTSLTHHWDLLWQMVVTDLRGRYVGSSLGLFWSVIHPLVMIVIYTVVFSQVMGARMPNSQDRYAYGLYLCSGLLPWMAFQEVVLRCTTLFPDNAGLVRKVAFPKSILYGYVTISSAINMFLAIAIFMIAYFLTGHRPHATLLLWLPFIALQLAFGLGLGVIASVVHVFLRDTSQLVGVGFQLLFWATPIVYVANVLPPWLATAQRFNPLYAFTSVHRMIVLDATLPGAFRVTWLVALTAATLGAAILVYRRFRGEILDEL